MSNNLFEGVPQAVATIVSACYGSRLGGPPSREDEIETRIISLTDKLTRTFAKALSDGLKGEF